MLILILFGGLVLHWGRPALEGLPMAQQLLPASLEVAMPALVVSACAAGLVGALAAGALWTAALAAGLLLARHLPVGMGRPASSYR